MSANTHRFWEGVPRTLTLKLFPFHHSSQNSCLHLYFSLKLHHIVFPRNPHHVPTMWGRSWMIVTLGHDLSVCPLVECLYVQSAVWTPSVAMVSVFISTQAEARALLGCSDQLQRPFSRSRAAPLAASLIIHGHQPSISSPGFFPACHSSCMSPFQTKIIVDKPEHVPREVNQLCHFFPVMSITCVISAWQSLTRCPLTRGHGIKL